jgi:hypothetical protein
MPTSEVVQFLEPGRYWVDVFEQNRVPFQGFVNVGLRDGALAIEETEDFEDQGRSFVIFTTTAPRLYTLDLGLPPFNVAGPNIKCAADTVSRPDPEKDPLDKLSGIGDAVGSAVKLGILAMIGYAIFSHFSKSKT